MTDIFETPWGDIEDSSWTQLWEALLDDSLQAPLLEYTFLCFLCFPVLSFSRFLCSLAPSGLQVTLASGDQAQRWNPCKLSQAESIVDSLSWWRAWPSSSWRTCTIPRQSRTMSNMGCDYWWLLYTVITTLSGLSELRPLRGISKLWFQELHTVYQHWVSQEALSTPCLILNPLEACGIQMALKIMPLARIHVQISLALCHSSIPLRLVMPCALCHSGLWTGEKAKEAKRTTRADLSNVSPNLESDESDWYIIYTVYRSKTCNFREAQPQQGPNSYALLSEKKWKLMQFWSC